MYRQGEHKVFVASSLKLKEQRQAVEDAIDVFNNENHDYPISFTCVEYENYPQISQVVEKKDAQEPINAVLRESSIFFLIIEHDIKPLTLYEFAEALERFRKDMLPRYIFVFRTEAKEEVHSNDNLRTYTYEELLQNCALIDTETDMFGNMVNHFKVYDIPFTDYDDLKAMIIKQLKTLPPKLPPARAKLGQHLGLKDFYSNPHSLRIKNSPKAFYSRKFDYELRQEMENRRMVLVTGFSLCGKTRSVMEAIREVCDGCWVYVVGDRKDELIEELKLLKKYIQVPDHTKLCIEIDNLDQLADDEDEESNLEKRGIVRKALRELIDVVMYNSCDDMIVATASDYYGVNVQFEDYDRSKFSHIKIPPLSEAEFRGAIAWFRSCGVENINEPNTGYMQLGALFVNLNSLKTRYVDFLGEDTVHQPLLKALKAQSIWRDDAFGNKELLRSMTEFFARKGKGECYEFEVDNYREAVKKLCKNGWLGVTTTESGKRLNIEEFVYRYVIGYDGRPIDNSINDKEQVEMEKELVKDIIGYCYHQQEIDHNDWVGSESLTRQVSRIVRRCDHSAELTPWLYNLWSGNAICSNKGDEKLAEILQNDRIKCEETPEEGDHSYSGLVRRYLMIIGGFNEAYEVYCRVPEKLRVAELFAALMRTAKENDDRKRLQKHPDYIRFANKPEIVLEEMAWVDDYKKGKDLFKNAEYPYGGLNNIELAMKLLDTKIKAYDLFLRGRLLHELARMVNNEDEFEDYQTLLRENVICLIPDRKLLADIRDGRIVIVNEKLTLIDVLAVRGWWAASRCAVNVYGNDVQSCVKLESNLLGCIKSTLDNGLTNELQIRMVVSAICAHLINRIAKNTDYEDVYGMLFAPLEIGHPLHKGRTMILRNTFTYTAMMECRGMDVRTSIGLFANDLIRHVHDKDNPLSVTLYTVNRMLAMCMNEKKTYIDQINNLYDQLGLKRDIFAYNYLIYAAHDLQAIRKILKTMKAEKVDPDIFTYLNIQRNAHVDFQTALRFLYCSNCIIEGYCPTSAMPEILADITPKIQQNLHTMQQAWINLLGKDVDDKNDKNTLKLCLKHLREKHPELVDNRLYNVVLNNNTFINDVDGTIEYIEKELKPGGFKPDGYTAEALLKKVKLWRGVERRAKSGVLNKFIIAHPDCLNQVVIAWRLTLFRKQDDSLEFVFFDEEKKPVNKKYSPIGYLRQMVEFNIPLNSYVISYFLKIKDIRTQKTYNDLADLLQSQQEKGCYMPQAEDIRIVRELILPYCTNLPVIYKRMTPYDANKSIAWSFKMRQNQRYSKGIITQEEVTDALNKLDWSDANSALWSLTEILDKYVEEMRDSMQGKIWPIIKNYYRDYVIKNQKCNGPTSFTFNLLAKSFSKYNVKDRQWLFIQLKKYSSKVIITPHLLGELARSASTVEELIQQTQSVKALGCKPNSHTADTYVFWLNSNLLNTDYANAAPILKDLLHYVFEEGEDKDLSLLQKEGRSDLMLDIYKDRNNVSANLLHSLLAFNSKSQLYPSEKLAHRILELFQDSIIGELMNRLAEDKELAREYIPLLFDRPRYYSQKVLYYLTSPEQLPPHDKEKYDSLIEKYYTYNYPIPESVVPNLLQCLSGYDWESWMIDRLINVYVNVSLSWSRQGDLIMQKEKLPEEYKQWCHPMFDSLAIRTKLDKNKQNVYPILIKLCNKSENVDLDPGRNTYKALRKTERSYYNRIPEWDIKLEELMELPRLWFDIGWKPSEDLVLAIVRAFSHAPHLAAKNIIAIAKSLNYAVTKQYEICRVFYNSLGDFSSDDAFVLVHTEELKKAMPDPFILDLCNRMINNKTSTVDKDKNTKKKESDFITKVKGGEIDSYYLTNLPLLLKQCNWNYSPDLVFAIIDVLVDCQNPSQELVLSIISLLASKPDIASRQIVSIFDDLVYAEKKNCSHMVVRYNSLGEFPTDSDLSVIIPTCFVREVMPHPFIVGLCKRKCHARINNNIIKGDESDFVNHIKEGCLKPKLFDSLAALLSQSEWNPSQELIVSLIDVLVSMQNPSDELVRFVIGLFAKVPNPSQELVVAIIGLYAANPDIASLQIAGISDDINRADKYNWTFMRLRCTSLGDTLASSDFMVSADDVRKAMPHPYIVNLCVRTVKKTNDKMLKKLEYDFLGLVNKGAINKHQLRKLPKLWVNAKWTPSDALRKKINLSFVSHVKNNLV